jgi:hypothetical protein
MGCNPTGGHYEPESATAWLQIFHYRLDISHCLYFNRADFRMKLSGATAQPRNRATAQPRNGAECRWSSALPLAVSGELSTPSGVPLFPSVAPLGLKTSPRTASASPLAVKISPLFKWGAPLAASATPLFISASPHFSKNPPRAKRGAPHFAENQRFMLKFCGFPIKTMH